MPIDPEKISEYFGIKAETTEQFIEEAGKKFIPADQKLWDEDTKARTFGRTLGSVAIGIKQLFDEDGIQITGDDLKQPPEAVAKLGLSKLKEKFAAEKAELEKTAGLSADEKIKEAQEMIGKLNGKVKDYEGLLKKKADEFEQLNQNKAAELKKFKVDSTKKEIKSSIQWNPDKDEYSRKGFLADMEEKYIIDLDENGEDFIVDRSTGSRIKAEGSHSTFMKPKEVYQTEALKAGLAAVNKKAGSPAPVKKVEAGAPPVRPAGLPVVGRKVMANTRYVKE